MEEIDFDGVFKFTNATDEDFTVLWNNKEYTFLAGTCSPLIIPEETLENIQEIRKKFAYKLATREFYKGKTYKSMSKMGGGLPPTFDDKILEPEIEKCLKPLPMAKAKVKLGKKDDESKYTSKAVQDGESLNETFKDQKVRSLGKMSDTTTS